MPECYVYSLKLSVKRYPNVGPFKMIALYKQSMIEWVTNSILSKRNRTVDKRISCEDHSTANIEPISKGSETIALTSNQKVKPSKLGR